jgi:hypothetical protein
MNNIKGFILPFLKFFDFINVYNIEEINDFNILEKKATKFYSN